MIHTRRKRYVLSLNVTIGKNKWRTIYSQICWNSWFNTLCCCSFSIGAYNRVKEEAKQERGSVKLTSDKHQLPTMKKLKW